MAVGGAEEHFAKKLANNEKKIRDRALKRLQAWIASRPSSGAGFGELELLKIWKGLFYCFWMSDKPLIQEELAENISKLQHSFKNKESGFTFIKTFFKTMQREWHGIDRLRLDKFYLLVRMFIKENFDVLKKNTWDPSICSRLCDIYKDGPLHPTKENVPDGIRLHFTGLFLTELGNVVNEKASAEIISLLLEPFFILAAETQSQAVSRAVTDGILKKLLEKRIRLIENAPDEDDDANQEVEKPLQINYQAIGEQLFALGSNREVLGRNRKLLYLYAKNFKMAAAEDTKEEESGRKRKLEEDPEQKEVDVPTKKQKKQKKLKSIGVITSEKENQPEVEKRGKKIKKGKKNKKDNDQDTLTNEVPIKPKRKRKRPKKNASQILNINENTEENILKEECSKPASNGLEEDLSTNEEPSAQSRVSETVVEQAIKELRNHVTLEQNEERTPLKKRKKKDPASNETSFATFHKTKTPQSAFFKKALSRTEPRKAKATKLTCPKSDPQTSKKKVRIHLHKNIAQSPLDYTKSVTNSPAIPFDSNRSPEFGLLKTKPQVVTSVKKRTSSRRSKAVDYF